MSERELREALAAAQAQVAELLPYALAGAEALDLHEPYGMTEATRGEHHALCEAADVMVGRIRAGEFGCRCGRPKAVGITHGPVKCYRPVPVIKRTCET